MTPNEYLLYLEDVHKRYPVKGGGEKTVLDDIDLRVRKGELISVVGPSGCGKSTMLRLILGSEPPSDGRVLVSGKPVEGPGRERGIVFQKYSLFPHLSVRDNIVFGLDLEEFSIPGRLLRYVHYRKRKREYAERAQVYLERMQLGEAGDKFPHELSGGMRQRVAMAQAAIMHPEILMMDEPFGALDDATRQEMQVFLLELWEQTGMTVFFVTHDLEEALFLGTRVLVLSQYYQQGDGVEGAKIVTDKEVPGGHPKPSDFKYTPEFSELLEQIRRDGLDPESRQKVEDFDLSHQDAWRD
ncbi:MAG: ABC transporter ATP-binding protein [bacterium]|nr:ABC transporter ATP-binding protein [bacterium]